MWSGLNISNLVDTVNSFKNELENKMDSAIAGTERFPNDSYGLSNAVDGFVERSDDELEENKVLAGKSSKNESEEWVCESCNHHIHLPNCHLHDITRGQSVKTPQTVIDKSTHPLPEATENDERIKDVEFGPVADDISANEKSAVSREPVLIHDKINEESLDSLKQKLKSTMEILAERERQLESMLIMHSSSDISLSVQDEIKKLKEELRIEREKSRGAAKQLKNFDAQKLEWIEKDRILAAYVEESKVLAQSQSDMERTLRRVRAEHRSVLEERDNLKNEGISLAEKLSILSVQVEEARADAKSSGKQVAALQASGLAASARINTLETELAKTKNEIISLNSMLNDAMVEVSQLQEQLSSANQREEMLAYETAHFNAKEAEIGKLSMQISQLQEELAVNRRKSGTREDALQDELSSTRQKWRDAIQKLEALQSNLNESNAPLLRQVANLQDELRSQAESQAKLERGFSKEFSRAESQIANISSELLTAKSELADAKAKLTAAMLQVQNLEEIRMKSRLEIDKLNGEIENLENSLERANHVAEKKIIEFENKARALKQIQDQWKETSEIEKLSRELTIEQLKNTINVLTEELEYLREEAYVSKNTEKDSQNNRELFIRNTTSSQIDILHATLGKSSPPKSPQSELSWGRISRENSNMNFNSSALLERAKHNARMQDKEIELLKKKVNILECERDALASEITEMSKRTEQLEISVLQANELSKKHELLLDLLGEKEEQVESLYQDLDDAKLAYKGQLMDMLSKIEILERQLNS